MSRLPLLRIRFCGGCNPEIDRGETVAQVINLLRGRMDHTFDLDIPADLTLHVCGCAHACLDEESPADDPEPEVSIQGIRVNRRPVEKADLIKTAAEALLEAHI